MFRNMKVGTRLIVCFLAVALLGVVVAGIGIHNMDQMNERARILYQRELLGVSYAKEANINLIYINRALRGAMLAATEKRRQTSLENVEVFKKTMQQYLDLARPLFNTEEGKQKFAELDAQLRAYNDVIAELARRTRAEELQAQRDSVVYLFDTFMPRSNEIDDKMTELARLKEKTALQTDQENMAAYEHSRGLMLILALCSLAAGVVLGVLITRSLTRQLGGEPAYAAEVANRIASGDLVSEVQLRADDRASLLFAMSTMRAKLAEIVTQVRGGTDAIASASGQIAAGNLDLSSRTEEQASSLEETASSMEELTSTVKQNADNARQANALAMTASSTASKGGAVVAQVVETMGSIRDSSSKIVDIIGVIDGIAFQTNILALNAAVEAARAGEQGRGFAVVAGEVRTLAQRSAAAAKEIKQLIGDSVSKVESGSQLVDQAGGTMHEVVESIQRVADIMSEITAASQEQTAGIEQINQAIIQMDNVTQQNAGLVEEAAAASEALQEQAGKLSGLVSLFRVEMTQAAQAAVPAKAPVKATLAKAAIKASLPAPVKSVAAPSKAASAAPAARPAAKVPAPAGDGDWEEF
ncbi:methyl-accepting chemotaxis protein [Massilia forsythiae]|uniref:Methyl-accepting chemotaxis protein n=1 Tax=Massilia forsythiae TaxID=2728020 RepID=A0A7Z2VWI6_9BURK|nr:methyl-accepting chemotaxis protein [Massilia forsythiae]QJE00435.1 methyl-accepting chemotaxis protein [Massilia forsythiae]